MASKHWSVPSACNDPPAFTSSTSWGRQPNEGVSLMKAPTLGCPSRLPVTFFPTMDIMETDRRERYCQPVSSPSPHVVDVKRQPTHGYIIYSFFFHISCPLLHNFVDLKLTDLWSLCQITFLGPEKWENHCLIPHPKMHLMPKHVSALRWPRFWRRRRFVFRAFFLPIYI